MLISTYKVSVALLQMSSGSFGLTIPRKYTFAIHDCSFYVYSKKIKFENDLCKVYFSCHLVE